MKMQNLLLATASVFAFACTKSDQTSADSLALAAKSQATQDSIAAAERANAATATTTPADTAAPAPEAKKTTQPAPTRTPKGTTAAAAKTTPTKVATPAPAPAAAPTAKPEVKAPVVTPVAAPPASGAVASIDGKPLYDENCRKCHGVIGVPPKAIQAKFPKIMPFNAAFFATRSEDSVVTVLTKGKDENMKSFRDKLTRDQMKAVAVYIRSFAK
jgi:mono/diheme cytochrome c family protein